LVGHQLETLPAIAEAAGAGELGWSTLRLLARVAEPASETKWLDLAQEMSVGQLARVVGAYRRASDADDPDRSENQRQRRGIWLFDEPDGLVRVTGLLEPDDAAVLRAALVARGKRPWRNDRRNPDADAPEEPPDPGEPGEPARLSEVDPTLGTRDPVASRRVDALVALARAALAADGAPDDGDDLAEVLVVVDHDVLSLACEVGRCQIHDGPPISSYTARPLCCDARIRPLIQRDGEPLALGRAQRLVNRAQRRALRFRDGPGCAFPGCAARHAMPTTWSFGPTAASPTSTTSCCCAATSTASSTKVVTTAAMVAGRPRFFRPGGTPIRPPDPPPADPSRGATTLRRRHRAAGHNIDQHSAEARSGGAPWWSPQPTLDALLT
jgi:hypothetical protein